MHFPPVPAPVRPALAFALALAVALVSLAAAPVAANVQEPEAELAVADPIPADVVAVLTVPRPDLTALEPAARIRIESIQEGLEELLAMDPAPRADTAQAFGFLGQVLHALDMPGAALEAYGPAHRLLPEDHRWIYYMGMAHQELGDLEAAVRDYRRYVRAAGEVEPGPVPAVHLRLGEALLELDRLDEAEAAFRKAVESGVEPMEAPALYGLGRLAAVRGNHEAAVRLFTETLSRRPDASVVHYPLAQALRQQGEEQMARYHLVLQERSGEPREVTFPDPLRDALAQISRSVALEVLVDLAVADDFSESDFLGFAVAQLGSVAHGVGEPMRQMIAYRTEGGLPEVAQGRLYAALGALVVRAGQDEAARQALEQAVELDPSLVEARLLLGNTLARAGEFAAAEEQFDRLLELRPDSAGALVQRGAVRANLGQMDEARRDLEAAVEADPTFAEAHLRLGNLLERQEDRKAAEAAYRKALEEVSEAGDRAAAWTALASLARSDGDLEEAAASYSRALDADPLHGPALSGLAGLLGQAGRFLEAATLYRRLVELEPANRQARLAEVTALVAAGSDQLAAQRLEAAVQTFPEDPLLKHALARHLAAAVDPEVRSGERAVELAEEANRALPNPATMETLAMAYAQAGRFESAVEMQQRLLEILGEELPAADRRRLEANLERYRQGRTCCATAGAG